MPFDERYLFVIAGALFSLSLLYDLISGRVRWRGLGTYWQKEEPRAYWLSILAKTALIGTLFGIGWLRFRGYV